MLTDFFRINLPYGIRKSTTGVWRAFNREYLPLGFNTRNAFDKEKGPDFFVDLPIYTKYAGLTDAFLLSIAHNSSSGDSGVQRNDKGEIIMVWLYNDETNPMNAKSPLAWENYFIKIKRLSSLKRIYR